MLKTFGQFFWLFGCQPVNLFLPTSPRNIFALEMSIVGVLFTLAWKQVQS